MASRILSGGKRSSSRARARVLGRAMEALEDRRLLAAYFVNMTNAGGTDVTGYMRDNGAAYGDRADVGQAGVEYGWVGTVSGAPQTNTGSARNRNSGNVPPAPQRAELELYDSFNHLQQANPAVMWEIAVPNGFYSVHIASGDPTANDSRFQMLVEGVQAYDYQATAEARWAEGDVQVIVTDGKLTVRAGPNATNAKLNFVEATSIEGTPPSQAPVLATQPETAKVRVNWNSVPLAQSYDLYRGTSAGTETLYQPNLTATTYTDTSVTVGTTYYYYVVPKNSVGAGPQSNEVSYRVSAPFVHVNYQPVTTANPTPAGYLKDTGDAFGDRGNGFSYGWWNAADSVTPAPTANPSTRERVNAASPDQRYDTLIHMRHATQSPLTGPTWWEINLPNGTYQVRLVAGDVANADSFYSFIAEANKDAGGVPQIDGSGTSLVHYNANGMTGLARFADSGFMTVTVTDGNLTISEGPDAANSKVLFIDIDTYTLALPPANPTALSLTNVRASQVTLNWTDNSADETGFRIEQSTDGVNFTPVANAAAHPGTGGVQYVLAGLNPQTQYHYRVYAVNAQGDSAAATNVANTTTAVVTGGLTGRVNATSGDVNLTAEGALDWAHWGSVDANTFEHKSGSSMISNVTPVGSSPKVQLAGSPTTFSWSDGTVTPNAVATANTLGTFSWGHGFTFTVPADTTPRALKVYVGVNNLRGQITARLSDGSAADYVDSSITSATLVDGVYTLVYSAASAGQTLSVTWIELPNNGDQIAGRLSMKAATLQSIAATSGTASSVTATALNSGRVQVKWADNATGEEGYFVQRAPDVGGAAGAFAEIARVAGPALSYFDGTAAPGTKYHYRVVPYNVALAAGTASGSVTATTVTGPFGTGARATYYDAPDLSFGNDPTLGTPWATTSVDPTINFAYGTAAPAGAGAGFGADTFIVRWSAKIKPEFTGQYVFGAEADDGYRLYVNGVKLLDNLSRRAGLGTVFESEPITLIAGETYELVYDIAENTGDAGGRLYWSSAANGLGREIIPQAVMVPGPSDADVAPVLSSVITDARLPVTAAYDFRQHVSLKFSDNVGDTITNFDLTIQSLAPGGQTYDGNSFSLVWDAPSNTALLFFDQLPGGALPDGNYRLTLDGWGVNDAFFNYVDGDNDGQPGGNYVVDFFVYAGSANGDRTIDFNDLVTLAQNYGAESGKTHADGDFNHDGKVDFNDLVILAQKYNTTLPPPPPPAPVPSAARTAARPGTKSVTTETKPAAAVTPPAAPTFSTKRVTAGAKELLAS